MNRGLRLSYRSLIRGTGTPGRRSPRRQRRLIDEALITLAFVLGFLAAGSKPIAKNTYPEI